MSVATRPPPALQDLPAPSSAPVPASLPERPDSLVLRLVAFAALAAWATGHWAGLVVHPGGLRMTAVVLVAVGTAATLGLLGRLASSLGATVALAAIVTLAGLVAGLLVAGLPARLLPPAGLGDLGAGVNRGLSGLRSASWPYDGPDAWVRQVLLIGLPLFLGLAAAVGFWPSRRRSAPRLPALALLLLVYGIAVANRDPGQPLLRGLVLLALVAAWLWLPR